MNTMVLVPTYNERENIASIIPKIFSALPETKVMVIDDGSPDGTVHVVRELQTQYPGLILFERNKKEGLGRAYVDAFRKVFAEYPEITVICTMDADLSHDPAALPTLLGVMEKEKADYVIGSRYIAGGKLEGWEFHRHLLSRFGNRYCRLVTRLPIQDSTSGFNCARTDLLQRIDMDGLQPSGYAIQMALKYTSWKLGGRIREVPITFRSRLSGESKISMRIIEEGILLPWQLLFQSRRQSSKRAQCPLHTGMNGRWWFTKNNCDIYRCADCRLVFVSPLPSSTAAVYTKDYFCGAHNGFGYINYDTDKESDSNIFSRYLDAIEAITPTRGSLLDIGAATGAFLNAAKKRGWTVHGIEISPYAAETARKKGLTVDTGTIETVPFPEASFDVITLWDVFEHVTSPQTTLQSVARALKPGGMLVINTPNASSLYARLMGKLWPLIIPPEHLHLFCEKNIRTLLENQGFSWITKKAIGKSHAPAYIFHIIYTIHKQTLWKTLSDWIRKTPLNRLRIPINVRDNMFIVVKKK